MNQLTLISVVVPVYNVEKYLYRCVDSIRNQTYQNLEIILVDDGSTDNSGVLCDEIAKLDSRIKVVHKKNGGSSSARNAGIAVSTGDCLGFVDSDVRQGYSREYNIHTKTKKEPFLIVCQERIT